MKLIKGGVQQNRRRIAVLARLQNQLKSGTKNVAEFTPRLDVVPNQLKLPLTDKDISRIKREISILEQLIG